MSDTTCENCQSITSAKLNVISITIRELREENERLRAQIERLKKENFKHYDLMLKEMITVKELQEKIERMKNILNCKNETDACIVLNDCPCEHWELREVSDE